MKNVLLPKFLKSEEFQRLEAHLLETGRINNDSQPQRTYPFSNMFASSSKSAVDIDTTDDLGGSRKMSSGIASLARSPRHSPRGESTSMKSPRESARDRESSNSTRDAPMAKFDTPETPPVPTLKDCLNNVLENKLLYDFCVARSGSEARSCLVRLIASMLD